MGFQFYDSYYGNYIGFNISGAIGKDFIYQVINGKQIRRKYFVPFDPKSPGQLHLRDIFKKAVQSWQSLSNQEKEIYEKSKPKHLIMSGYNFFIKQYMKVYI